MPATPIRKGQYWACRNDGNDNGDLIIGVVVSARLHGDVIFRNLLTNGRSTKADHILLKRNKLVSKRDADKIVQVYREMQPSGEKAAKDAARAEAIDRSREIRRLTLPTAQLHLPLSKKPKHEWVPPVEAAPAVPAPATLSEMQLSYIKAKITVIETTIQQIKELLP